METVADCLAHAKWLVEKGRGQEPCKLFLPRIEMQRRKANKEGYKRVVFQVDEQLYRDWAEQKDRYVTACGGNVPIAFAIMLRLLQQLETSSITKLAEDQDKFTEGLESA